MPAVETRDVEVRVGGLILRGILGVPRGARGVVLFAHGSGSGRLSPRNGFVARVLQESGLATLLVDLLTMEEEREDAYSGHLRFDIDFLAERLLHVTDWLAGAPETAALGVSYFGASTGAAAALQSAARRADEIRAVVSRGGRPDLAMEWLPAVRAPTLLIVGGDDRPVIALNREAYDALRCERELIIVPGATHLFEEPGTLEEVARLAADWLVRHAATTPEGLSS
ncbi:MAG TPA: dienelactone hydrolase family protein [Gemmatimonadaceae bacterium]|nr:dienelactone hydrolase family protein [Gemmatimonadaceae bacterium]